MYLRPHGPGKKAAAALLFSFRPDAPLSSSGVRPARSARGEAPPFGDRSLPSLYAQYAHKFNITVDLWGILQHTAG